MNLSVLDRLLLLGLLPAEGDITTLRIIRTLREELSFTEQEHADLHLKQDEGRVTWEHSASLNVEPGETGFFPVPWPSSGIRQSETLTVTGTSVAARPAACTLTLPV